MAFWHEVLPGETTSSIAARYGFRNYKSVYQHSANLEFRNRRPDPDIIFPGDRIYIPDFEPKLLPAGTEQRHHYVASIQHKVLRLRLQDFDGAPFVNTRYELHVGSDVHTDVTNDEGLLEKRVPVLAQQARLKTEYGEWAVNIGELNPIDNTHDEGASGIQMRLRNLGFDPGPIDAIIGPRTQAAIQGFQKKHSLEVDGICGPKTAQRLIEEHGS